MNLFELGEVLFLFCGALAISGSRSPIRAREIAIGATALAALFGLCRITTVGEWGAAECTLFECGFASYLPLVYPVIGLAGSALSSVVNTSRYSYATMLVSIAAAVLIASGIPIPPLLCLIWLVECGVVSSVLRQQRGREDESRIFLLYQGSGLFFLVIGLLLVATEQDVIGVVFLVAAISVRQAIFPFHSWFPAFVEATPIGVSVCFFLPQSALVLFAPTLESDLPGLLIAVVLVLSGFGAIYGSLLAVVQVSVRRALAYLFLSNSAMLLFGLLVHSEYGIAGAGTSLLAMSTATAGFAMTIACLEARKGALQLRTPSGNYSESPRIANSCLLFGLMSIGIPGSLAFFSEELLFQSVYEEYSLGVFVLLGSVSINAITVLKMYAYLFNGNKKSADQEDFSPREAVVVSVLLLMLCIWGFFPGLILT